MPIDFTFSPEVEQLRARVRNFIDDVVRPNEHDLEEMAEKNRSEYRSTLIGMRERARSAGVWLPHMPPEWGGMGLAHVELAMVQAEAAKATYGPFALNCQAPDEGNMHTLLHWGTGEQKEKYLRPLCKGTALSCFAMTGRARGRRIGSDPDTNPRRSRWRGMDHQRTQVVHFQRTPRPLRDRHRSYRR